MTSNAEAVSVLPLVYFCSHNIPPGCNILLLNSTSLRKGYCYVQGMANTDTVPPDTHSQFSHFGISIKLAMLARGEDFPVSVGTAYGASNVTHALPC